MKIHRRAHLAVNMKATTLLILVGLAACGGSVASGPGGNDGAPEGRHAGSGSGPGAADGAFSDTGSGSGMSSGDGGSSPGSDATLTDGAVECHVPQIGWVFCGNKWRTGGSTGPTQPACPGGLEQNSDCPSSGFSCVSCSATGHASFWTCTGGLLDDSQMVDACSPPGS
jgi:hypothetical protein